MKGLVIAFALLLVITCGFCFFGADDLRAEEKPTGNKVDAIKAGKEEGTIEKDFFKKMLAERPSNVSLIDVRTPFEYQAGHFDGATHIFINDLFNKGCDQTISRLPKEGYVIFVCATGARAGEMYFGLLDDCKYNDSKRLYFLDANVEYTPRGPVIR